MQLKFITVHWRPLRYNKFRCCFFGGGHELQMGSADGKMQVKFTFK